MNWTARRTDPQTEARGLHRTVTANCRNRKRQSKRPLENLGGEKRQCRALETTYSAFSGVVDLNEHTNGSHDLRTNTSSSASLHPSCSTTTSEVTSQTGHSDLSQIIMNDFANLGIQRQCVSDRGTDGEEMQSIYSSWEQDRLDLETHNPVTRIPSDVSELNEEDEPHCFVSQDVSSSEAQLALDADELGHQLLAARTAGIVAIVMNEFFILMPYYRRSAEGSSETMTMSDDVTLSTSSPCVHVAAGSEAEPQGVPPAGNSQGRRDTTRKGKKRLRRVSEAGDGDQEDGDSEKDRYEVQNDVAAKVSKRFACPYAKKLGYSADLPQACVHPGFGGIHRLK